MKKQDLLALVRETLEKYGAVNIPLVLAVSGGPDSMVLLDLVRRLLFPVGINVVHVNHGLRKSAARDQKIVEQYCKKYGLACTVHSVDVASVKKSHKGSVEEVARELRYKVLRKEAKRLGATYILVAHTANDQAETMLFNLVRGGALRGMGGMKEWSGDLLRPLLATTKEEILRYAASRKVEFAKDESNDSLEYTRNFLRKKVIPQLQKVNPNVILQMTEAGSLIQEAERAVRDLARLHVAAMSTATVGRLTFPTSKLVELTPFMRAEVIKFAAELLGVEDLEWTRAQFEQIDKLLTSPEKDASRRLFGKLLVAKAYDKISISLT